MSGRFSFRVVGVVVALFAFTGCHWNKLVADNMSATMDDQKDSFYRETSIPHAKAGAPALLKLLDGFVISSPKNPDLLERAAELNCGFAMLLLENDDPEWASSLYMKGHHYAMRALAVRAPEVVGAMNGEPEKLVAELDKLGPEMIGPVFWAGECLGGHMNLNRDDVAAIANMDMVVAFANAAQRMDPTYFFGGPEMFLGVLHGTLGEEIGGKPELSKQHFEQAFKVTEGKFLFAKIYFAKTYCVQTQNRQLFEETLNSVMDAPDDLAPEFGLVNAVSKVLAEELLDTVDDLFLQ